MAISKTFQARPLLIFFILAVAIALVAMAIRATDPAALGVALGQIFANNERADIISGVRYSLETPVLWNALLFPAAPTLAAFVVIWLAYGRRGLGAWLARLAPWRGMSWREGIGVWLAVFVAFLAYIALYALYTASHGQLDAWPPLVDRYGGGFEIAILTLALSLLLSSGPLLEEMGWRAFALPLLLTRFSPLLASVGVGLLWAFWHLPREIAPLMSGADGVWMSFLYKQLDFVPGCIAASIIATFLYFKLGGSVWAGILAHAIHNEMNVNVMRTPEPVYMIGDFALGSMTVVEVTLAAILIIVTKGQLGAESTTYREPHPFLRPEG